MFRFSSRHLAAGFALSAAAFAHAGERTVYDKELIEYGTFPHYAHGPQTLGMVVYRPSSPPPNGAAVVGIVSGGFFSKKADDIYTGAVAANGGLDYDRLAQVFLERGFTFFALTHGDITTFALASTPRPGFLIPEIQAQVRRGMRFIKSKSDYFGIDADRIGVVGASSGGALALGFSHSWIGTPADPYFDPAIDTIDSQVAAVAFSSAGGDLFNYRGLNDHSWICRMLRGFVHPDLSGLVDPNTGLNYPSPPAPPCPNLLAFFDNMGNVLPGPNEQFFQLWPEANYDSNGGPYSTGQIDPNWQAYPYPRIDVPGSVNYCPTFFNSLSGRFPIDLVSAASSPTLAFHGEDDVIVDLNEIQSYEARALAVGAPIEVHTYPGHGHYMIDSRNESMRASVDFLRRELLGVDDADGDGLELAGETAAGTSPTRFDTDGDLVNDAFEVEAGTNPLDPNSAFRITSVNAVPVTSSGAKGLDVTVTFAALAGRTYVLQRSTDIQSVAIWSDVLNANNLPVSITATGPSANITFFEAHDQNAVTAPAIGSVYYRVRPETSGGFERAHTAPMAVSRLAVSRAAANSNRVNYLIPPVFEAPRITWRPAPGSITTDTLTLPAGYTPASTLASRNILLLVRDGSRSIPASNSDDFGAEGKWWRITGNTGTTVTVDLRHGQSNLAAEIPADSLVAIVPMQSLRTLFGPLPAVTQLPGTNTPNPDPSASHHFGIAAGDRVYRFQNRGHNNPGSIESDFYPYYFEVKLNAAQTQYEWVRTWTDGSGLVQPFGDGSSNRFYPDEIVKVDAAPRSSSTFAVCAGTIPQSGIDAYLLRGFGSSGKWRSIPGWPFPESVGLFDRVPTNTRSELLASGWRGDCLNPTSGDTFRLIPEAGNSLTASPFYSGDEGFDFGGGVLDAYGFIDPRVADGPDMYYHTPPQQSWPSYIGSTFVGEIVVPGASSLPVFHRGRGVEMRLRNDSVAANRIFVWKRRVPYPVDG